MAELHDVVQNLIMLDEDELAARIGMRSQAQSWGGEVNDSLDDLQEMEAIPRGALEDFLNAGKDFFTPVNAQAYKILCTEIGSDSEIGKALNNVMDIKTTEAAAKVTALISPILVTQLALPQSLAVLVGTLIVKKVAKVASDFTCSTWKKALEGESPVQDAAPANG
jgi:hypothetical protein